MDYFSPAHDYAPFPAAKSAKNFTAAFAAGTKKPRAAAPSMEMAALAALFDDPVTYVKQFAEALGSVTLGYFVSFLTENCKPGEWVMLNDQIVQQQTGLSPKQWRLVRSRLADMDLLYNKRTVEGSWFTLHDELLERLMRQRSDLSASAMMSPPLSINRLQLHTLSARGMGIKSILMLACIQEAVGNVPLAQRKAMSEWVALPEKQIFDRCYLSRREQEHAIMQLNKAGLIEVTLKGMPATKHYRYSLEKLGKLTLEYVSGG